MTYKEKGVYHGYWENGQRHGEGILTYPNKDTYSGWWKYGKKEGHGVYTFASTGMKFVGTWRDGNFVQGKWMYPNGMYYEGEFEKNKPKGRGNVERKALGRWYFVKTDNTAEGDYTQSIIEEETAEGDKITKVKVDWKTDGDIVKAAENVNAEEL